MQKRWFVRTPHDRTDVEAFRSLLKIDPIVAELLLQRGLDTFEKAENFFRPKLEDLHDPFLMKDMDRAVDRLIEAINEDQRILLYGDYDVDGTTAVALMLSFLKQHSKHVDFYIPDRYSEGYGVSEQGIDFAIKSKTSLIITLDCGVKANDKITKARNKGIDVIVCDHHRPGSELPRAIVLDPKREDCAYPFEELSGCGVGFKLLQALCKKQEWETESLFSRLDLLAISIGADLVELTGENRILCSHGMKRLNAAPRAAFKEMLFLAKREFPVSLTDVVFTIAPRINAAGRLRSGKYAVELMVSKDLREIKALAKEINEDNVERRSLDKEMTQEALAILKDAPDSRSTNVVFAEHWHKGVVGIVASRIIEKYYKPTIVLTESNGMVTGSARSVKHFDVHNAIEQCADLLEQFGGHKYAAGLTMKKENIVAFQEHFEKVVSESIDPAWLIEEQVVDVSLDFDQIFEPEENRMRIPKLKRILRQFEPHGPGNMKPVFISKNVFSTDVRILKEEHLKLSMTQPPYDLNIDGIGFGLAEKEDHVASGVPFDVVYTLEINHWRDKETLQLNLKDIREI